LARAIKWSCAAACNEKQHPNANTMTAIFPAMVSSTFSFYVKMTF
jgi:hypothetical protein